VAFVSDHAHAGSSTVNQRALADAAVDGDPAAEALRDRAVEVPQAGVLAAQLELAPWRRDSGIAARAPARA
jgi:hypothetical protein